MFFNTPSDVDLFTRSQTDLFAQFPPVRKKMAFMSFFGNSANGSRTLFTDDATNVDIDIVKDNTTVAAFATRGVPAGIGPALKTNQGMKATHDSRMFPIVKEIASITAQDGLTRQLGEDMLNSQMNRFERMRMQAYLKFDSMIRANLYLFELIASESMLTGKMTYNAKGDQFDFRRDADNTATAANPWDTAAGKPLDDIDDRCLKVDYNGDVTPDGVFLDPASYQAFLDNDQVKSIADNKGYSIVWAGDKSIGEPGDKYKRYIDSGWVAQARLKTKSGYQVWIFTTVESYKDKDNNRQQFMPAGTCMVTSTEARFDRYFGPDDKLPTELRSDDGILESVFGVETGVLAEATANGGSDILDLRQFKFFARKNQDNSAILLECQTAPIYAPTQVDGVAVINGLLS